MKFFSSFNYLSKLLVKHESKIGAPPKSIGDGQREVVLICKNQYKDGIVPSQELPLSREVNSLGEIPSARLNAMKKVFREENPDRVPIASRVNSFALPSKMSILECSIRHLFL
jgi:hypothetical protein